MTRSRWLLAAGLTLALALSLTLLLEPVNLAAGLHGPDGRNYLSMLHSLFFDGDLLLYNDNALIGQHVTVTSTGYALELHNIGTALAFLPFYALGHWTCLLSRVSCTADNLPTNVWLSAGNWAYGLVALVLMWRLVARHTAARWATIAVAAVALGSPFFYYWTRFFSPHMPTLFLAALLVLVWDRSQNGRPLHLWLLVGVLAGAAATVASYNIVILLLPASDLVRLLLRRRVIPLRETVVLAVGVLAGFLPQMVAWWLLFGNLLGTPYSQQLFWLQPGLPDLLVSAYHGLYFYSPVLLLATVGFVPLYRRERRLALTFLLSFAALVYVSSCNIAWWGGASFGARYLLGGLPFLVLPLAVLLEQARWRGLVYGALALCIAWSYGLFLADFARMIDPGQYIPAAWQLQEQLRVLGELPALLRRHLLTPRFDAALVYAVPLALLLTALSWLAGRIRRMPRPAAVAAIVCLPLLVAGLLALSKAPSQKAIARLKAEGSLEQYPQADFDRYDLCEGYWQRGAYRWVRGDLDGARGNFGAAQRLDPARGWVRLHAAGRRYVPHPLEWRPDGHLTLIGWEAAAGTVTLYWHSEADVLSPTYRTVLRLTNAVGEEVAAYVPEGPDGWRALAGDMVRVTYPLAGASLPPGLALTVTLYPADSADALGHVEVDFDEP